MMQTIPSASSLLDELTRRVGGAVSRAGRDPEDLEWLVLTNGDTDPFDSVILLGFGSSGADPLYAAKVPRMPRNGRLLRVEYARLSELWELIGPAASLVLPEPIAFVEVAGQPALVLGYIKGSALLKFAGRGFWAQEARAIELARDAACSLRRLHDQAAVPLAQGERIDPGFDLIAAKFQQLFTLTREEESALSHIADQMGDSAARATHKVLIQGDFWHGNLIRSALTGMLVFVDWQYARWSQDVSIDVYLFLLAAAFTAAPYGAVEQRARGAARTLARWRSTIRLAYLDAYGQPERYALLPEREGMLAACVEKAVRPAFEYGYSHPDDLMWRFLFAELIGWPGEGMEVPA